MTLMSSSSRRASPCESDPDLARLTDTEPVLSCSDFPYLDQKVAPFNEHPVILPRPDRTPPQDPHLADHINSKQGGRPFERRWPTAPAMANLDDWQLLYRYDSSIAFLGVPMRIIPFHIAHIQARYLARFWSGKAQPLRKLDWRMQASDPERWTSTLPSDAGEAPSDTLLQHDLGPYPGDVSYGGKSGRQQRHNRWKTD
jgi:hypothetical protein